MLNGSRKGAESFGKKSGGGLVCLLLLAVPCHGQQARANALAPSIFSADVISDANEQWRITFSPDGNTAWFAESPDFFPVSRKATIYVSQRASGKWSEPVVAEFSGTYTDMDPFLSPDGRRLYFSSIRPIDGRMPADLDLWMVERTSDGWSEPVHLGSEVNSADDELYSSESIDGTLYFASGPVAPAPGKHWDIYNARRRGDGFHPRSRLGPGVNTVPSDSDPHVQAAWEFNPEVSRDGKTLYFTSLRPGGFGFGDIYVSRLVNGDWTRAANLGPTINTDADEYHPTLSPAGTDLFFVRRRPAKGNFYHIPLEALGPLPTAPPRVEAGTGGVIVGIAIDSIYGAPLRGAIIHVGETGISGTTDSSGYYRIAGVPRGQHRLLVTHPLLDTLRLALRTIPRDFGDSTEIIIATPSPATVVTVKCTPQERATGNAMALGFVTLAGSEDPVKGATVRMEWTDYEVAGKRLKSVDQVRSAVTSEDGSYKICGIPEDLETGIYATSSIDTTTTLLRSFKPGLAIASFRVAPPSEGAGVVSTGSSVPATTIRGRVADTLGRAVEGARVATDDGQLVGVSNANGEFEIAGVRPGTRGINVRRIGFLPVSQAVEVPPNGAKGVQVQLSVYVPVLETVRISARRDHLLERIGFTQRSRSFAGRFLGPEEIARRNPHRLHELLRMMPMLRIYYVGGEPVVTGRRGECVRYFVDGQRWFASGDTPDKFLIGSELGAIEVYSGLTAPAEFSERQRDGSNCTSIVIWTKWKLRM